MIMAGKAGQMIMTGGMIHLLLSLAAAADSPYIPHRGMKCHSTIQN
jgi:hypothetical protein